MISPDFLREVAIKHLATSIKDRSFAQHEGEAYPDFRIDGTIATTTGVIVTVTAFNDYGSVSDREEIFRIGVEVERL